VVLRMFRNGSLCSWEVNMTYLARLRGNLPSSIMEKFLRSHALVLLMASCPLQLSLLKHLVIGKG